MSVAAQIRPNSEDLIPLLRSCALFQEVPPEAIEFASRNSERVTFLRGDCIILENEANDWVYFISQGSVEIVSYLPGENRIQRLALLKAGSQFAEFSVLTQSARSGSAYAFENCTLVRMDGAAFLAMLKSFPAVTTRFLNFLAERNLRTEKNDEFLPLYRTSQLTLSQEALQLLPLAICQKLGLIPTAFHSGLLTVIAKNPLSAELHENLQKKFPQTAVALHWIIENEFEAAFQTAQRSLKLSLVPSSQETDLASDDVREAFLSSELFQDLKTEILDQIFPLLKPVHLKAGQTLQEAGSEVECYYLIAQGELRLYRKLSHVAAFAEVLSLSKGSGYGEAQILHGGPCDLLIRAHQDTTVYPVPASIIKQLLKVPAFSLALAKSLAKRLQVWGHNEGVHYFKSKGKIDFEPVAHLLPTALIEQQKILPLQLIDQELLIGAVHPDSSEILTFTKRYLLNYRLKLYAITEDEFKAWYLQLKSYHIGSSHTAPAFAANAHRTKTDITQWLDRILELGMNNRASDIHFEPTEDRLTIRFRIDGVLQEHSEILPAELGKEVISRLKILSEMDISQFHLPQDGQLKVSIGKNQIVARASSVPVRHGEKIVLRLIRSQNSVVPLGMLSPDRRAINIMTSVTRCRQGLFLVTGPTGSGKTTTLYSMLNAINDIGVNVITLEDPVEMEISGFNQIEMDRKRGLDFSLALRSVLRQDPNVIMVGEIRDQESAKIVMEASITGHMVLSTLHTSSAFDIAPRMAELGVTPATMASGLLGVLNQRLLRVSCKKCLTSRPALDSEKELLRRALKLENAPQELHHSVGCPACAGTGYRHRTPIFEIWRSTPEMKKAILERASSEEMMLIARQDGFETLLEAALKLVVSGTVSLEEVRRVLSNI